MKILVAPLNWGLGHASRCVPLVQRFLDEGHEVILGGNGESLTLLRKHFPTLRYVYLAPLQLRYSAGKRQVWAMIKAMPRIIRWAIQDHAMLQAILKEEPLDLIVSDNRFGLYINPKSQITNHQSQSIYLTHQLHIMLPKGWKWAETIASRIHARIYTRFNKVWVPDFADPSQSLAGELSHPSKNLQFKIQNSKFEYIGPLSRFTNLKSEITNLKSEPYEVVALLSGLEPHRTMLEKEILTRFAGKEEKVLIIQGLMHRPNTRFKRGNITIVPYLPDRELAAALLSCQHIIARSGYSTIMDLEALGLLTAKSKKNNFPFSILHFQLELIPTPGQPEQEYLATLFDNLS